ncbi:unnamed protein product [Schistosoma margrebowiei]|uniref:Uncharacterized protein n=1 Tax=Schistosoma margrebowiei TaxID=48269 RepID=A0A183NC50_9TREM|nr:unnamed protein product [Schistosoma margrebowiei]
MKTSIAEGKNVLQRTARNQSEDLVSTDDPTLLYHKHQQTQTKTTGVPLTSLSVESQHIQGKMRNPQTQHTEHQHNHT